MPYGAWLSVQMGVVNAAVKLLSAFSPAPPSTPEAMGLYRWEAGISCSGWNY